MQSPFLNFSLFEITPGSGAQNNKSLEGTLGEPCERDQRKPNRPHGMHKDQKQVISPATHLGKHIRVPDMSLYWTHRGEIDIDLVT